MAKGKQKVKTKTGDELKPTKTSSSKKEERYRETFEDDEPLFGGAGNQPRGGATSPALMTKPMNQEYNNAWPPTSTGGAAGVGAWGGAATSAAGSWQAPGAWEDARQSFNEAAPPPLPKSPLAHPAKGTALPDNTRRYTGSIATQEATDEYDDDDAYQDHQGQGGRAWGRDPPLAQTPAPPPASNLPLSTHVSPAANAGQPLPSMNDALVEYKSRPPKVTSASEAAKKVDSKTSPANRDSFWSKAHQVAADERGIFHPKDTPVAGTGRVPGQGPQVVDSRRASRVPLHQMKTAPAWMAWGDPQRNRPRPAPAPAAPPPPQARPPNDRKGASWHHWGQKGSGHHQERFVPRTEYSTEEDDEEWEEDEDWGWQPPTQPQRGGHSQAWGHAGGGRGGAQQQQHRRSYSASAAHQGWGRSGGGSEWGAPNPAVAGGAGRGRQAVDGYATWGHQPKPASGHARGGPATQHKGNWDDRWDEESEETYGGYDDGAWGHGGGGGAGGWGAAGGWNNQGTTKVTMNPSAAGAAGGAPPVAANRNDVSAYERSQILNSLLNAAVDQKPKDKQPGGDGWGAGGAADGWGTGGGAAPADGWGQQPQAKEQEKKEKRGWVRWGSKVKKEDSAAGKDKKMKKKGKKEDNHGGWGTTVIEEEEWGQKAHSQQKGGWEDGVGGGDTSGWGASGQQKGPKKQGGGAWNEWGGGGGGGAWAGGGGNEDGWGAHAGTYTGDDWGAQGGQAGEESWGGWEAGNQSQSRSKDWGGQGVWGGENGAPGMTSQTMLHAREASFHPSSEHQQAVTLLESNGQAFEGVKRAFIRTRSSKDRFHWLFPPENDERVVNIINWIKLAGPSVATLGLHKFLESRERGALFVNAAFRLPEHPRLPVFDWMTFDQLQSTADKMLQESVYSYNPAAITVVFIYLPSPSGNSVAIWRRKVPVPEHCAVMLQKEIGLVMMGLRPNKEYICWVDEPQPPKQQRPHSTVKHHSMQQYPVPMKQYPPPSTQPSAAMQHAAMYKSANASHTQKAHAHQAVPMKKQQSTASLTTRKVKVTPTKAKVEVKKKRKWWQIFK